MKEFVETEGEGKVCLLLSFACLFLLFFFHLYYFLFIHLFIQMLFSFILPSFLQTFVFLVICSFLYLSLFSFSMFYSSFFQLLASFILDIVCSSTVKGTMSLFAPFEKFRLNFSSSLFVILKIFSILNHPCSFIGVLLSLWCFSFINSKLLFSGWVTFNLKVILLMAKIAQNTVDEYL